MQSKLETRLASELERGADDDLLTYIEERVANPDPGSRFEVATRDVRRLPRGQWIGALIGRGYDGLLFLRERQDVAGHAFFQHRGDTLHAFSLEIWQPDPGVELVRQFCRAVLRHAWRQEGIERVYLGAKLSRRRPHFNRRLVSSSPAEHGQLVL